MKTDILIVGSGCSGLYCALNLAKETKGEKQITIITKSDVESSDSFLAQGGMCMLKDPSDFDCYFEDTMRAGHYENDATSVSIMIQSSPALVQELLSLGVDFEKDSEGNLLFTREGAHREKRIVFHEDITGKEITSKLLATVRTLPNITMIEHMTLVDLLTKHNTCYGAVVRNNDGRMETIQADYTILATGGVGGVYEQSTNFRHLTGDALAIAALHQIALKDVNYVQIHPTTLYSKNPEDRAFLISESVRGEGAKLYGKDMNRFTNELLPRDELTEKIYQQMEKDHTEHVWEDLRTIPREELETHFPNIIAHCKQMGYDVFTECIPVVPAQHYFMGGIRVNYESKTSMEHLYAIGETACNGVHGKNRLASNSLLESLVFAKRAALDLLATFEPLLEETYQTLAKKAEVKRTDYENTEELAKQYYEIVWNEIKKMQNRKVG